MSADVDICRARTNMGQTRTPDQVGGRLCRARFATSTETQRKRWGTVAVASSEPEYRAVE